MKIIKTKFKGLFVIKHKSYRDNRGYLREIFNEKILKKKFNFEYYTYSKKNVLRGFHFQKSSPQSKYINVLKGKIIDCVIDLRIKSKTFGKKFKITLSEKNSLGLFVPRGFAHAYYTLEKENIVYYKLDNFYKPSAERGIIWNDKSLKIKWPSKKPLVSHKDKNLPTLSEYLKKHLK